MHVYPAPSPIQRTGIFARSAFATGDRIIEYSGEKITKDVSLQRSEAGNHFIFSIDDEFDLDGNCDSNLARFINHSCSPNCETILAEGRIWVVALRPIVANEELTFNYGYDLEFFREHPCHCGSADCAGYIVAEEFLDHLRRLKEQCAP
jgi:SET domain-containing protein